MNHPGDLLDLPADHPHVQACERCQERRAAYEQFTSALGAARVWQEADPALHGREAPPVEGFVDVATQLELEAQEGRHVVARLVSEPSRETNEPITPSIIQGLLAAANQQLHDHPARAFELATLAGRLQERIPWEEYPNIVRANTRGGVFSEQAKALRHLGRHQDALAALAEAREEYESAFATDYQLAIVDYVAGTVLREQGELDEALRLTRSAAGLFRQFSDDERLIHCQILEGAIIAGAGRHREARDLMLEVLPMTRNHLGLRAQVHNNIGQLSIELQEHDLAGTHLLQALLLFRENHQDADSIRVNWGLGKMLIRTHKYTEANQRFLEAEQSFLAKGMVIEAALVTLDRIEARLTTAGTAQLADEVHQIVQRFRAAGMTSNALVALSYLTERLADGTAQTAIPRVRHYFERLHEQPRLLFLTQ